jgi:hypothetical protein
MSESGNGSDAAPPNILETGKATSARGNTPEDAANHELFLTSPGFFKKRQQAAESCFAEYGVGNQSLSVWRFISAKCGAQCDEMAFKIRRLREPY